MIFLSICIYAQRELSMNEAEIKRELSMSETEGRTSNGVYRYFAKGESKPYTGVLTARYPNGKLESWQEYVDGQGHGKWINYYENGNIKEEGYYNRDRVEGPIKKYYPSGMLKSEGTYKDWRIWVGVWKYYDSQGNFEKTIDYGNKGSIEEVQAYFNRGDIPEWWYKRILRENGFM